MSDCLRPCELKYTRIPCPSLSPGVCSSSCLLSQWYHPAISFSVIPFSSCPQYFPASGSFPMSQLFTSDSQSIGTSASASILPMNIQDWFLLGLTDLIALIFKGLSRVFSSPTIWKHQFFGVWPSLWSNSQICMWLLEENIVLTIWTYMGILEARILEWVAMPSSKGSSQPRDHTQVSHIAGRRFNLWATSEALP